MSALPPLFASHQLIVPDCVALALNNTVPLPHREFPVGVTTGTPLCELPVKEMFCWVALVEVTVAVPESDPVAALDLARIKTVVVATVPDDCVKVTVVPKVPFELVETSKFAGAVTVIFATKLVPPTVKEPFE